MNWTSSNILAINQTTFTDRAYSISLGSNLGTTATSLIAVFSFTVIHSRTALRLALCQVFFSLFGILLFFIVPKMRIPLFIAIKFGNKAVKYKWFSIFYISFFLLPLAFYGKHYTVN